MNATMLLIRKNPAKFALVIFLDQPFLEGVITKLSAQSAARDDPDGPSCCQRWIKTLGRRRCVGSDGHSFHPFLATLLAGGRHLEGESRVVGTGGSGRLYENGIDETGGAARDPNSANVVDAWRRFHRMVVIHWNRMVVCGRLGDWPRTIGRGEQRVSTQPEASAPSIRRRRHVVPVNIERRSFLVGRWLIPALLNPFLGTSSHGVHVDAAEHGRAASVESWVLGSTAAVREATSHAVGRPIRPISRKSTIRSIIAYTAGDERVSSGWWQRCYVGRMCGFIHDGHQITSRRHHLPSSSVLRAQSHCATARGIACHYHSRRMKTPPIRRHGTCNAPLAPLRLLPQERPSRIQRNDATMPPTALAPFSRPSSNCPRPHWGRSCAIFPGASCP
jgi:hypothetical protein